MVLILFLAVLLVAVLLAMTSIYADLRARDRAQAQGRTPAAPAGPPEGVWPPPPTDRGD